MPLEGSARHHLGSLSRPLSPPSPRASSHLYTRTSSVKSGLIAPDRFHWFSLPPFAPFFSYGLELSGTSTPSHLPLRQPALFPSWALFAKRGAQHSACRNEAGTCTTQNSSVPSTLNDAVRFPFVFTARHQSLLYIPQFLIDVPACSPHLLLCNLESSCCRTYSSCTKEELEVASWFF